MTVLTDDLARLLDERPGRVVVGLTGAPGAGKSTLAARIIDEFNSGTTDIAALVPMDGFHLSNAQLTRLGRRSRCHFSFCVAIRHLRWQEMARLPSQ